LKSFELESGIQHKLATLPVAPSLRNHGHSENDFESTLYEEWGFQTSLWSFLIKWLVTWWKVLSKKVNFKKILESFYQDLKFFINWVSQIWNWSPFLSIELVVRFRALKVKHCKNTEFAKRRTKIYQIIFEVKARNIEIFLSRFKYWNLLAWFYFPL